MAKEAQYRSGTMEVSRELAHRHIEDQAAGGLPNSWREGTQNGIDSPGSSIVRLMWSPFVTVISDDGEGMDLFKEEKLLTKLGLSGKERDDHSTYGQFGVGWGQVISKGLTIAYTKDSIIIFDYHNNFTPKEIQKRLPFNDIFPSIEEVENEEHPLENIKGLNYQVAKTDEDKDGMTIILHHYEDSVPDKDDVEWESYEEEYRNMFKYVPRVADVDIHINGEELEPADPLDTGDFRSTRTVKTTETGDAHIAVCNSILDDIDIFSQGLKVTDIDGEGLKGRIITKRNLGVNIARNDIKHSDTAWKRIKKEVEQLRIEVFDETRDGRLYENARCAMLRRMKNDSDLRQRWSNRQIIPLASGDDCVSLDTIQKADEIGIGDESDDYSDQLLEAGEIVLDGDSKEFSIIEGSDIELPSSFDLEVRAEELGLTDDYELIPDDELNTYQLNKLMFARMLCDKLSEKHSGFDRDVFWGYHDSSVAWTNGYDYIALTDNVTKSNMKEVWMHQIHKTLVHESVHDVRSDDVGHGAEFNKQFRKILENSKIEETITELSEKVVRDGLQQTLEEHGYSPDNEDNWRTNIEHYCSN